LERIHAEIDYYNYKKEADNQVDYVDKIKLLKEELENIIHIKEHLLQAMEQVEDISQKSVKNTAEISIATEGQATGAEDMLKFMEDVQHGMDRLSEMLNQ